MRGRGRGRGAAGGRRPQGPPSVQLSQPYHSGSTTSTPSVMTTTASIAQGMMPPKGAPKPLYAPDVPLPVPKPKNLTQQEDDSLDILRVQRNFTDWLTLQSPYYLSEVLQSDGKRRMKVCRYVINSII